MRVLAMNQTAMKIQNTAAERMEICFKNLSAVAYSKQLGDRTILNPMSGRFDPGSFTALIGPSGCGKTTFMSIISGRLVSESLQSYGQVYINGVLTQDINQYGNKIGYVLQDDVLLPTLTPKESFEFVVKMRLPQLSSDKQQTLVDDTIERLGLSKCKDTIVGNNLMRGISGGEKKRTAIGCEFLINPLVLFLDEPTTGLDSTTALHIMQFIKTLAGDGRTVISTIHQPSSQLFNEFSRVMMLCDGNLVFHGAKDEARQHFQSLGYKVPAFTNPCDYYMKLLNKEGFISLNIIEQQDEQALVKDYNLRVKRLSEAFAAKQKEEDSKALLLSALKKDDVLESHCCNSFALLLKRSLLTEVRNPLDMKVKILSISFQSLVSALLYYQKWTNSNEQVRNIGGALFFISMTLVFQGTLNSVGVFNLQRVIFVRERISNLYSTFSYYMALSLAYVPLDILLTLILVLVTYWACNLVSDAQTFFIHLLISLASTLASSSLGLVFSALIQNYQTLISLIPVLIIPFMLVAGFYNNAVPIFLVWLQYTSLFKFTFAALLHNQFTENITCTDLATRVNRSCNVMAEFYPNIKEGLWLNFGILCIFILGLRVIAFILLQKISSPKRNSINSIDDLPSSHTNPSVAKLSAPDEPS